MKFNSWFPSSTRTIPCFVLSILYILTGCISDKADNEAKADPYSGLTCGQIIDRINKDLEDFNSTQPPLKFKFPNPDTCPRKAPGSDSLPSMNQNLSVIDVWSNQAIIANANIYDYKNSLVRTIRQSLGFTKLACTPYQGSSQRTEDGLFTFYILWDELDSKGVQVDDGAYLWKLDFETSTGVVHRELMVGTFRKCIAN